jgi:hydroxyacylglutathione hydrolase
MKSEIIVVTLVNGELDENCYLIYKAGTRDGILVDPGSEPEFLIRRVREIGVTPLLILATHGHFDHIGAAQACKQAFKAPLACAAEDEALLSLVAQAPGIDQALKPGQELTAAGLVFKALATAGHTPGGMCYYFPEAGLLFSGDTLFQGTVGRTDFPGGSARELTRSLRQEILPLPDETKVYPGHGEATTLRREKKSNPYLRG